MLANLNLGHSHKMFVCHRLTNPIFLENKNRKKFPFGAFLRCFQMLHRLYETTSFGSIAPSSKMAVIYRGNIIKARLQSFIYEFFKIYLQHFLITETFKTVFIPKMSRLLVFKIISLFRKRTAAKESKEERFPC